MKMSDVTKPGYLIQFSKQTSMLGEMITINTNLPFGATREEISAELVKIGNALNARMEALNEAVIKRSGKSLEDIGVDTGTVFLEEHVGEMREKGIYKDK
jgi:hypothetical protein